MVFTDLCRPALIYLVFSITQIVIDSVKGLYNTALIKIWVAFIFTILLNYLCSLGLGIISWFIVFIPFVLMTLVVAILLLFFERKIFFQSVWSELELLLKFIHNNHNSFSCVSKQNKIILSFFLFLSHFKLN